MRLSRYIAISAVAGLVLTGAAACQEGKLDLKKAKTSGGYEIVRSPKVARGSTMRRIATARQLIVGVEVDAPGVGDRNPATGRLDGFDIEIAKIIAGQLGLDYNDRSQVIFKATAAKNRESFIRQGAVDIVIAAYPITDSRKKLVSFAGPYYRTGQDLLIRKDDRERIKGPGDLTGKRVCAMTGSVSLHRIQAVYRQAKATGQATDAACVKQLQMASVDVVTSDGAMLLGYAARNPDKLVVVGKPFSTEEYGIGLKKEDRDFRAFLDDTLAKAVKNGAWKAAYDATLGRSGSAAPQPPALDRY